MRTSRLSSFVALVIVASLGASAWSTCGYAAAGPQTSGSAGTQGHPAGCAPGAPEAPLDACEADHRIDVGVASHVSAATIEKLHPVQGPTAELIQIFSASSPFVIFAGVERPVLKLPQAPLYLVFSVFLL